MPYTIDWYNGDQDIIVVRCTGRWTWAEVIEADNMVRQMGKQSPYRVDCICDLSGSPWVPPEYTVNVEQITAVPYSNLHTVVFIARDLIRDLIKAYNQEFRPLPYRAEFAVNMDEAFRKILRSRRSNAPSERPPNT